MPNPYSSVRRLVFDSETGGFLKADGTWTPDESVAMNFLDIDHLIKTCRRYRIQNAEMLLRFVGSNEFDVRFHRSSLSSD